MSANAPTFAKTNPTAIRRPLREIIPQKENEAMKPNKHKTPVIPAAEKALGVEFSHEAPEAKEVFLAGSFNDWNVTNLPMSRDPRGVWRVRVPLAAGSYEYRFIADGVWNDDPRACAYVPNQFGWCNCVVEVVPAQSESRSSQS